MREERVEEWKLARFKDFARSRVALIGQTQETLALRIGTKPQNVSNWFNRPGSCTVRNFATMVSKMGFTDEQIGYFVRKEAK